LTDIELYFRYRCEKGLAKKGLANQKEYIERLNYEISVISRLSYCSYFLIVSDIIRWSLSRDIPVGPGRGSGAGALVSFVLEITHLDPIKYGLIFERFLNPDRVAAPDLDLDFCEERRNEVISYIESKYGADRVAHIGTFGSMKARAAIRDVSRTLGLAYEFGDNLAKMILEPVEGKAQSLETCYEKVPELKAIRTGADTPAKEVLIWAERLEDRIRSFGTHASGLIISATPIAQSIPLYPGKDGAITTQFDMGTVDEIGLVKFDLLGLRGLTTIQRCINIIASRHKTTVDILNIPPDDKLIYQNLQSGDVSGIFQLEASAGMRDLLVQIRPTKLEDLSILVAIYRPGPLGSEFLSHYLKVRAEEASPHYSIPELEPILSETGGMLIYQEQILEICKQLAGYTMAEADLVRRAVGKKKKKEMDAQHEKFVSGMIAHGIEAEDAERVWGDIETFASYGFCRAHAICYGFIAYQMAYLKAYYPIEFMCSCLISDSDEEQKIIKYIGHCQEKGIEVLGPSINESQYTFSITSSGKAIRFGLGAIKNLGKPVQEIIDERDLNGPFRGLLNFSDRVDLSKVNRKKLESLILAGAFNDIDKTTRASLLAGVDSIYSYKENLKRYESKLETYRKRMLAIQQRTKEIEEFEQGIRAKRPSMFKAPDEPLFPIPPSVPSRPEIVIQDLLAHEKELTGYYISGHPLNSVKEKLGISISQIKEHTADGRKVQLIAIPSAIKEATTKKTKQRMAYLELEDKTGTIQAIVLPKPYSQCRELIDVYTPARYDVQVEVVEGDMGRVTKLTVENVAMLPSVAEFRARPIDLLVPLDLALPTAQKIRAIRGKGCKVGLSIQSSAGSNWKFKPQNCAGQRVDVEKELKGT
jgi:DNA polymerase-3 subunit alpha